MLFTMSPFYILSITIMISSTLMAMSASNWLFLWAAMELNLLSFIPILMNSKKFQETEAAIKYFLAQALGSSVLLMSSMSMWFNTSTPANMMYFMLLMSITLKLGMVPCHLWYPSVMSSISWMACLILSTWQKAAPLMILSFILYSNHVWVFIALAGSNAIIGGLMGMNQTSLRSIMAYSSITHMGWMTSLLSMFKSTMTLSYFIVYSTIIAPIFLIFHYKSMNQSMNISKVMLNSPQLKILLPILLLSLGGLPPLTGFIPKWMTIFSISNYLPMLTIILIAGAMMNTYYYLNIIFNFSMANISMKASNFTMTNNNQNIMSITAILSLSFFPLMFFMM